MSKVIGALWLRETKERKQFMSGVLNDLGGDIQIAVFRNDRKDKDNQPDYQIVRSEKKEDRIKQDNFFGNAPVAESNNLMNENVSEEGEEEIKIENIPF